jgi:ABC-type sulfate/molybdate transport systems ATPase subunit
LARALVGDARTLLLDEPFTGLDGQLKDSVIQALASWLNQHQLTALLVSHDGEDLTRLCRETVQLKQGQAYGPMGSPKIGAGACAASRS